MSAAPYLVACDACDWWLSSEECSAKIAAWEHERKTGHHVSYCPPSQATASAASPPAREP